MQHHVLVVDDEPDIRELLDLTLSRMGLQVTTAEDLGVARRALAEHSFSFCLTDMRLPDGNGLDLMEDLSVMGIARSSGTADVDETSLRSEEV